MLKRIILIVIIATIAAWLTLHAVRPVSDTPAAVASIPPENGIVETHAMNRRLSTVGIERAGAEASPPAAASVPPAAPAPEPAAEDWGSAAPAHSPQEATPEPETTTMLVTAATPESRLMAYDIDIRTPAEDPTDAPAPTTPFPTTAAVQTAAPVATTAWTSTTSTSTTRSTPTAASAPASPTRTGALIGGAGFRGSAVARRTAKTPSSGDWIPAGVVEALVASVAAKSAGAMPTTAAPMGGPAPAAASAAPRECESLLGQSALPSRKAKGAVLISIPRDALVREHSRIWFNMQASPLVQASELSALLVPSSLVRDPTYIDRVEQLRRELETFAHTGIRPYSYEPAGSPPPDTLGVELVLIPRR